jgi:hypothetical protein
MKESMMNMTKKTIVYGVGGTFLALALILGACQQPTSSTGWDGPGENTLELSGTVLNEGTDSYTSASSVTADVSGTPNAFSGKIVDGVLKGSISGVLADSYLTQTLNVVNATALINGTLNTATPKFEEVAVSVDDVKFIELELEVNTKTLSDEEITANLAQYQHYVYVSKAVTITAKGKAATIDKPAKAGTGNGSLQADTAFSLSLIAGWNTFYEKYDFDDNTYTIEKDVLGHWVLKN